MCRCETSSLGLHGAERSSKSRGSGLAAEREQREVVLPSSRVWVLLQGFIRGRCCAIPALPQNVARCPSGALCGVCDSPAEQMDLHNNNLTLSVLGAGQRLEGKGTCSSLKALA